MIVNCAAVVVIIPEVAEHNRPDWLETTNMNFIQNMCHPLLNTTVCFHNVKAC